MSMAKESSLTEKRKDQRLVTFIETASKECDGKIERCKSEIRQEIAKQNKHLQQQEARFQSVTDNLRNKLDSNPLPNSPVPMNQEQINRIDKNVQNLQCQLTQIADSMDATLLESLNSRLLNDPRPPPPAVTATDVS